MSPIRRSLRWRPLSLLFSALTLLSVASACASSDGDKPLIFAAASLADVLAETADLYELQTGSSVEFSFGGSNTLVNQIVKSGAPADGVVLAGRQPMDLLIEAGRVEASGVVTVAVNSLVVAAAVSGQLEGLEALAGGEFRVAIADPDLAPAGQYAKEALQAANAWDGLQGRLIPTLDVRPALAALSTGSVDYAIVYATDALAEPGVTVALAIDPALHGPVTYPAAAITGSPGAETAARFFDFLRTDVAQQIFARHGFPVG